MKNWKISPNKQSVASLIDCYWYLEKTPNDDSAPFPKLNPDPAGHLILSSSEQNFRYKNESMKVSVTGNHLIFPHCKTISMDHTQAFSIIGIKFRVGALYSLALPSTEPQLDGVFQVDVEKQLGLNGFCFDELDTSTLHRPEKVRDKLDDLLGLYFKTIVADSHRKRTQQALALFPKTPLADFGIHLGCSQRSIERSFLRTTGITLKQYDSMEKLESMLGYLYERNNKPVNWADLAYQFGFSDQPHLIRYLKSNIGKTPVQYLRDRDLAIDAYGNFE